MPETLSKIYQQFFDGGSFKSKLQHEIGAGLKLDMKNMKF